MKIDKKAIMGLVFVLMLINIFAFYWSKFLFTYGSIQIEEKVVSGLGDRKYLEISIGGESFLVLELNDLKTELWAINYSRNSDRTEFYYDTKSANLHLTRGEEKAYYQPKDVIPVLYLKDNMLYKLNPSLLDIWIPAESNPRTNP